MRRTSPNTRCAFAGSRTRWRCGTTARPSTTPSWTTRRAIERWNGPESSATSPSDLSQLHQGDIMNFIDGSLYPENLEKLVITVAPYGPQFEVSDFPEDIPVTMEEQVQKAVDCYNAGATVLHLHVRELDGKGSKRLSKFNELIALV